MLVWNSINQPSMKFFWSYRGLSKSDFGDLRMVSHVTFFSFVRSDSTWMWQFLLLNLRIAENLFFYWVLRISQNLHYYEIWGFLETSNFTSGNLNFYWVSDFLKPLLRLWLSLKNSKILTISKFIMQSPRIIVWLATSTSTPIIQYGIRLENLVFEI